MISQLQKFKQNLSAQFFVKNNFIHFLFLIFYPVIYMCDKRGRDGVGGWRKGEGGG